MSSMEEKLLKLREERIAREKARLEKLRQLNLQKYSNFANSSTTKIPAAKASAVKASAAKASAAKVPEAKALEAKAPEAKAPEAKAPEAKAPEAKAPEAKAPEAKVSESNAPAAKAPAPKLSINFKSASATTKISVPSKLKDNSHVNGTTKSKITEINHKSLKDRRQFKAEKIIPNKHNGIANQNGNTKLQLSKLNDKRICPAISTSGVQSKSYDVTKLNTNRNSLLPQMMTKSASKPQRISVFDRLYKPKQVSKVSLSDSEKLRADPAYLKKVIENSSLITGRRRTIAQTNAAPVRRSISAVHLKQAHKSELKNCIHSWVSVGEKLDKVDIKEVDEDDYIQCEKVVSAIKSETKKVKFQTPVTKKFNTPKPEELQIRLQNWLQKRGKSIDSYHHLQCFGVFHLTKGIQPIETTKYDLYDEEDKENIALESDSDDQSYTENLNDRNDFAPEKKGEIGNDKWRRASYVNDSLSLNDSKNTTLSSPSGIHQVDNLVIGALNDLTELLREGFDWEQCARWLRAIRERFPSAPEGSAYWECRAALEERRGDLPASMQCWEEAIIMGTERSVADANLDQLLDKFMQLKISPNSGRHKQVDQKMVDVKNVLKSTIIRFAVQKAKLRQSNQNESPKYTVTPVRRSARLSVHGSVKRTPLQVCTTITQASTLGHPVVFKRNEQLFGTP